MTEQTAWLRRQWFRDLAAFWEYELPYQATKRRERLLLAVAWKLPRWVVYWAGVRLFAHGTTGRYGETLAPTLTVVDALERWRDQ